MLKTFEQNEDVYMFLVLSKYHTFSFSTAVKKLQKIVICFPEDKLSYIYPDIHKVFMPWLIVFPSGALDSRIVDFWLQALGEVITLVIHISTMHLECLHTVFNKA